MNAKTPNGVCTEPFCGRPLHGWSAFCGLHAAHAYRWGHPSIRDGIREGDLRPYTQWVFEGLTRYRSTRGTLNVLQLINTRVLNYTAWVSPSGVSQRAARDLERVAELLRFHDVTASDILSRVCVFQAYAAANSGRWRGIRKAEDLALGRMVLRLIPLRRAGARYASKTVLLLADELRGSVVPYADKLLELIKKEAEDRRALVLGSLDLTTPAEVPADDTPRAGRAYRRRRGIVGA
jgi:hypothetical protein